MCGRFAVVSYGDAYFLIALCVSWAGIRYRQRRVRNREADLSRNVVPGYLDHEGRLTPQGSLSERCKRRERPLIFSVSKFLASGLADTLERCLTSPARPIINEAVEVRNASKEDRQHNALRL
jgi:hypothetical protein